MVSKANSTYGSSQALDYILNDKGQAIELDRNKLIGDTGQELFQEFRKIQSCNKRCQRNTFSIVLSPSSEYELTTEQYQDLVHQHLANLKLEDHQWVATLHMSTQTPHIHIIANRIDDQGKALKDNFISKKAQRSAEKLALAYGMLTARQRSLNKHKSKKEIKALIFESFKLACLDATSFSEIHHRLKLKNIGIELTKNSKGEIQGMRFNYREHCFKASQVHRDCRVKGLIDLLDEDNFAPIVLKSTAPNFVHPKSEIKQLYSRKI